MAPVLVWLRDHQGIVLNIEVIRFSIELRWIWKLAMEKIVLARDPQTGKETEINVADEIPEDITWPLRSYLGELPGFDPSMPLEKQRGDEPSKQHGFAQFYFTATFTQLAVSLGHIFRVECGDIDMRDVVLNRRILVVTLPALENSDATLAALGKLVVSSLRAMMAQLLGGSLEGAYTEADKPGMGPSPYFVVFDELAYYATSGLDRMLAMGRGLNVSFMLGFQEVSAIWARLGEKTASLLGNANLTIAMRQQDSGRTREWIEKTAGQTFVTQATSYQGAGDGNYREARHAEVRPVSRVDWNDLTSLIEGEAIVLFGGRRIYARVFHAKIDDNGPKRIGRTVMLRGPDAGAVRDRVRRLADIAALIEKGDLADAGAVEPSPVVEALRDGFIAAARANASLADCGAAALAAVAALPASSLPPRPPAPADGTPVTAVTQMLKAAAKGPLPGLAGGLSPGENKDVDLARRLVALERLVGVPPIAARAAGTLALAQRDRALNQVVVIDPPVIGAERFCRHLRELVASLRTLAGTDLHRAA
jgi:intracellular multiplication protein IcmO